MLRTCDGITPRFVPFSFDSFVLESCDQDNSNSGYNGSIIARREEDINLTRGVAEGADSNADQNQFEEPTPEEEKEEISSP